MVVYDGKNMTKAEKEQAKLKKAEEAYENFKLGIQLIRRNIKANLTEEGELCQVRFNLLKFSKPISSFSPCKNFVFAIIFFISYHSTDPKIHQKCVCKLNVTLEEAKQALEFMLQDLHDKVEVKKQECDNPINITNVHWECPEKIVEPVPKEEEETPITPNTSQLLKTLK